MTRPAMQMARVAEMAQSSEPKFLVGWKNFLKTRRATVMTMVTTPRAMTVRVKAAERSRTGAWQAVWVVFLAAAGGYVS
jgi:hypothetical protein